LRRTPVSPPTQADVSDKPAFVRNMPLLTSADAALIREAYQQQLESLLAVDEAVAAIVAELKATGELENTLVVFTADNGFMHGEHRLPARKNYVYEPSIRVPLVMRGPGIPRGVRLKQLVANIDLAPTIVDAADAVAGRRLDGRSLLPLARNPKRAWRSAVLLERSDAGARRRAFRNPPFTAIRTPRYVWVEYGTGERELYDLTTDPHQLTSRHADPAYAAVRADLARRLSALRRCAGPSCG
jgi:N-acetylglucosamine-6-sulfatase